MRATILLSLAVLAAFQPGFSEKPDIEQLRQEAEQGDNEAQFGLGALYHYQKGNYQEAAKWYRLAANQGHAGAQLSLGLLYYDGRGVPKDYVKAWAWINLAAQEIKEAVEFKSVIKKKLTAEQAAEAQKLSSKLLKRIEASKSQ